MTHLGNAWYQNWSPDGKKIAIVTEALVLYTMDPDGRNLTRLATGVYSNPFWSPDGRFIAFLSGERWGETPLPRGNLHLIPATGRRDLERAGRDRHPACCPPGWPGRPMA